MDAMRALIVGAGGMGKAWASNIKTFDQVELAGWCDLAPGAAQAACEAAHVEGVATGTDFAKMLAELAPDFVVDVTPPEAHHDIVIHSLEAGYPVVGEKPMAHTMEAAREMVAASERAGKLYMVSQSRRYDARLIAFRELIQQLGDLGILNVDFFLGPHFGGFREEMPSPLVLDMAIHTFDQARFLSGADAVAVFCHEYNPSWSWYKGDACANATFEMTNDVRYAYRGSWCAEGKQTSWEGAWRAVGSKGTATWDGESKVEADIVTGGTGYVHDTKFIRQPIHDEGFHAGIAGSLRDFVHALKTGAVPNGECHDNIKSLAMVFGAIESSRSHQRVRIDGDKVLPD